MLQARHRGRANRMSRSAPRNKKSLWSQTDPTPRLLFGAFAIAAIGLLGLTPREIFGFSIAWPYAALWGAVGWGRVCEINTLTAIKSYLFVHDFFS